MIGIISDAHGNASSFARAVEHLSNLGASRFVFLGDAIGYIPSVEVLVQLGQLGALVSCTKGNHESMFLDGSHSEANHIYRYAEISAIIEESQITQMESWPNYLALSTEAGHALFLHGRPSDPIHGYLYPDSDIDLLEFEDSFTFMGNTHRPFIRKIDGKTLVNVGSCSLPRDDGRYGSAAIFDPTSGHVELIRFEIEKDLSALEERFQLSRGLLEVRGRRDPNLVGRILR